LAVPTTAPARGRKPRTRKSPPRGKPRRDASLAVRLWGLLLCLTLVASFAVGWTLERYSVTLQSPVGIRFQWPLAISLKSPGDEEAALRADQGGRRLTAYQEYACRKFGSACRVALAIQRAENPKGACEIYHYNSDGTLDWGYFQINTVHLRRPGLNLRDLLDCKANIDFAYVLYQERGFQPWSTYNNGAYRAFLRLQTEPRP
jgi:hypothetical protein